MLIDVIFHLLLFSERSSTNNFSELSFYFFLMRFNLPNLNCNLRFFIYNYFEKFCVCTNLLNMNQIKECAKHITNIMEF